MQEFCATKIERYSKEIQNAIREFKICGSFMLAAGLFYAFNYNNKATMGFITNEAKIISATDIVTS
jgi:hypothetical protein